MVSRWTAWTARPAGFFFNGPWPHPLQAKSCGDGELLDRLEGKARVLSLQQRLVDALEAAGGWPRARVWVGGWVAVRVCARVLFGGWVAIGGMSVGACRRAGGPAGKRMGGLTVSQKEGWANC